MRNLALWLVALLLLAFVPSTAPAHSSAAHIHVRLPDGTTTVTLRQRSKPAVPIAVQDSQWVKLDDRTRYFDQVVGNREQPKPGLVLYLHLRSFNTKNEVVNDTLFDRTMLRYAFGEGLMPAEFDAAVADMKVGGRRIIEFSPPLKYYLGFIPAYADAMEKQEAYRFELTLLRIEDLSQSTRPHFK